jgi:hypothetical protein
MSDHAAIVRVPQRLVELTGRESMRVLARPDSVELQHLGANGELRGSLRVQQRMTLSRVLRHGGARVLSYCARPEPVAVCPGQQGYLLSSSIRVAMSRQAAIAVADALDHNPQHLTRTWLQPGEEWPARGYGLHETHSIYVGDRERFVVSLIVGYTDDEVDSPLAAARAALELTTDGGADGTKWFVYDRASETMRELEQCEFDPILAFSRLADEVFASRPRPSDEPEPAMPAPAIASTGPGGRADGA